MTKTTVYFKCYDREENKWISKEQYERLVMFLDAWDVVMRFRVYYTSSRENHPVD